MSEIILHHYDTSPFAEKVRLVLGYKQLAWRSVTVPQIMPKPDVVALTGGYRRTPFVQMGADVYCDTALICRVLDARQPSPSLYPPEAGGRQHMMAAWADATLFWAAIPYALQPAGAATLLAGKTPEELKAFAIDRAAMTGGGRYRVPPAEAKAQLSVHLAWLAAELADGRLYLCGAQPCIADFSVAHCLWFVRRATAVAGILAAHPPVAAWLERMLAIGHGQSSPMASAEAIAVAAASSVHAATVVEPGFGFEAGADVTISATDYGSDPVRGTLVGLTDHSATVRRVDERAGVVQVHFPRIGYVVRKAEQ
jgi:glutathione S-transferase